MRIAFRVWIKHSVEPEQANGIGTGGRCNTRFAFATQPSHAGEHLWQQGRFIAPSLMSVHGLVRGVGFQQEKLDRHVGNDLAQSPCALIGDRSADADAEAELPELLRLLRTAGKTVHDSTQRGVAADARRHLVQGLAGVDDQRQIVLAAMVLVSAGPAGAAPAPHVDIKV